jgi:hypothetical protein
MKNIILVLAIFTSLSAYSDELIAFTTTLEMSRDNLIQLAAETKIRREQFDELGPLSFIKKNQLERENCNVLNSELGFGMNALITSLNQNKVALKKLSVTDVQARAISSGLKAFSANSRMAIEGCKDIEDSMQKIELAKDGIEKAIIELGKLI